MKLNDESLRNTKPWLDAGIKLPSFDRAALVAKTRREPVWIHFGAGNIFRVFPAVLQQQLIESGDSDRGIIAAFPIEPEIIDALWTPCDNLSLAVTLKADGSVEKRVVASVAEAVYCDESSAEGWARACEIFANPSLQLCSMTITEKGYADLSDNGVMAKLCRLCHVRFTAGAYPLALVSMDNCPRNGKLLFEAMYAVAERNEEHFGREFLEYIRDESKLSFPWSMIDKITPRPDARVAKMLCDDGFENYDTISTGKGTFASAFVNAEEAQYLVIEDKFPNGRPPLEKAGVIFTDSQTVELTERMKVGTCLNPIHTALALFGCLLSYDTIAAEMQDPDLVKMAERLGYSEGMPVVADPKIISPEKFLHEVLTLRLPNPFIPDTPARIATDSSQKIPVRFGGTLKAYLEHPGLSLDSLVIIPLVFAAWCRYLLGRDDSGAEFRPSPDPMLESLCKSLEGLDASNFKEKLRPVLSDTAIFGINLYSCTLAAKTEAFFEEMLSPGGVRSALRRAVNS